MVRNFDYKPDDLSKFCEQHGIVRLSFFGSVLRDDFDPQRSDIDVLVEFNPDAEAKLTYFRLGGIAAGLEDMLGRRVDLSMANSLDLNMRDSILSSAQVQYDAARPSAALAAHARLRGRSGSGKGDRAEKGISTYFD